MVWTESQKVVLPLTLVVIALITIGLTLLLKNKSERVKQIPFIVLASSLLIMEVVKQVLSLPDYSLWSIPLHYCSTFMFWFSIASFTKSKVSEIGFTLSVLFAFVFFALFYINPGTIIGNSTDDLFGSFSYFHTFTYHHIITLFMALSISLGKFKPKLSHVKWVALVFTLYSAILVTSAHALQVNFTNMLESNIPFMQTLLDNYGYVVYTIVMYLFGLSALMIGFFASYGIKNIKVKKRKLQFDLEDDIETTKPANS